MDKVVVVKDPHFRFGRARPVGRKASFFEEVGRKVNFIIDYCEENKINRLLFTGDILDQKDPARYSFNQYKEIAKVFDVFRGRGIWAMGVAGNHDYVEGDYAGSVYADLVRRGLFRDLWEERFSGSGFQIIGLRHCYNYDLEGIKERIEKALKGSWTFGDKIVCVLHQNVVPCLKRGAEEFFDTFNYYTLATEVPQVDVWVCGHYHKGFPVQAVEDKWFINPWSLTRLKRGEEGREHRPELVYCDFANLDFRTVEIPHLPYEEAFEEEREEEVREGISGDLIGDVRRLREMGKVLGLDVPDELKPLVEYYLTEGEKALR